MKFSDAFMVVVFVAGALFFAQGIAWVIAKRRIRRERDALRRSAVEWSEGGSGMVTGLAEDGPRIVIHTARVRP
jgi:hypothetical protein